MKTHEAKILFWTKVKDMLDNAEFSDDEFNLAQAEKLVRDYETFDHSPGHKLTVGKIKEAFDHSRNDQIYMETIVEMAFADLAPYLRDPRARELVYDLISHGGMESPTDVFIHIRNVRPLTSDREDGPVAVTLVANSITCLRDLLINYRRSAVEHVHTSQSPRSNPLQSESATD